MHRTGQRPFCRLPLSFAAKSSLIRIRRRSCHRWIVTAAPGHAPPDEEGTPVLLIAAIVALGTTVLNEPDRIRHSAARWIDLRKAGRKLLLLIIAKNRPARHVDVQRIAPDLRHVRHILVPVQIRIRCLCRPHELPTAQQWDGGKTYCCRQQYTKKKPLHFARLLFY